MEPTIIWLIGFAIWVPFLAYHVQSNPKMKYDNFNEYIFPIIFVAVIWPVVVTIAVLFIVQKGYRK